MRDEFVTEGERIAAKAADLPAFSGFSLLHTKRQVELLLNQIGRHGIFEQYTRHDIQHVNRMLETLEWVVTPRSRSVMSPADWLLAVVSVYMHDLGMLVTADEFDAREDSGFAHFRDEMLQSTNEETQDYRSKIRELNGDDAERFMYQEFVRQNHARRVRQWISGKAPSSLGASQALADELVDLLGALPEAFRNDLGIVCESHHLDDLDDLEKYSVSRPYGTSDDETADVQFAAVLLRTADLLHITLDRTPSVIFRLINPRDPLTLREWGKQMAVRRVRSQPGQDREGNVDPDAPRNTVEVHATFKHPDGFFGLTAYLGYVEEQLKLAAGWVALAAKRKGGAKEFPWRYVDQRHIETEGFLPKQFEFSLDQARILNLLTGHTLYNDTDVVLRELVQNSLDAVRLRFGNAASEAGLVEIRWDTKNRVLTVRDNGTGMTQSVIEENLLKVGASLYQDPKFKERHPNFSPISRFGIGVLSTFMIADSVEVVTVHEDEEDARHLALRSVHGKYLIRLLEKSDPAVQELTSAGTEVKLTVRSSASVRDVLATARKWFVIPGCRLRVQVDQDDPVDVGFITVRDALEDVLKERKILGRPSSSPGVRVVEANRPGLSVAYAVRWSDYFQEWAFVAVGEGRDDPPYLGTSIEGVRVEFSSPGFGGHTIFSIANATGHGAPKTNVARSGIEASEERVALAQEVYSIYREHVEDQMEELEGERGHSLSWAASEGQYLLRPLLSTVQTRKSYWSRQAFLDEIRKLRVIVLEDATGRRRASVNEVADIGFFWTVDSALHRHAQSLLRELGTNSTLAAIVNALGESDALPEGPIVDLDHLGGEVRAQLLRHFEVAAIYASPTQRRVSVRWDARGDDPRWIDPFGPPSQLPAWALEYWVSETTVRRRYAFGPVAAQSYWIPVGEVTAEGLAEEDSVRIGSDHYVVPGSPLGEALKDRIIVPEDRPFDNTTAALILAGQMIIAGTSRRETLETVRRQIAPWGSGYSTEPVDTETIASIIGNCRGGMFDTRAWERKVAAD